jgi:hypothetical protein
VAGNGVRAGLQHLGLDDALLVGRLFATVPLEALSSFLTNQTERKAKATASGSIFVAMCLAGVEYVRFRL